MPRIVNVVGTRPNLVKMSSLLAAQKARPGRFETFLVHTGQHRDPAMSDRFFAELDLPEPDITLPGHSGTPAQQIGSMVMGLEPVLHRLRPDLVLVVGDVTSTAAAALAAAMLGIPIAHVEAGLRSFDRSMPEEVNRIVVDSVSHLWFASEKSGVDNLLREGHPFERIHHVGNVMIDALVRFHDLAVRREPIPDLDPSKPYAVLTLHRPSNVDAPENLAALLDGIAAATTDLRVVFPVHPRTHGRLHTQIVSKVLARYPHIETHPPFGYLDMLALLRRARIVLTDSGGLQEETTYLGIPCLTLRNQTERPATVSHGTNHVIGADPQRIHTVIRKHLLSPAPEPRRPPLWDGHAAQRIADILSRFSPDQGPGS